MNSTSRTTFIRSSVGTPSTPLRYFLTSGPTSGISRSRSEGMVARMPPVRSWASLAISWGILVTWSLATLASRKLGV